VSEARSGKGLLRHREVAADPSGRDTWSIVKLDWTYPPGSGKRIEWHARQFRRTLALPRSLSLTKLEAGAVGRRLASPP
jgi:hypothetical protein